MVKNRTSYKGSLRRSCTLAFGLTTTVWFATATAQNNQKPRIVREKKCKVQIEGGEFKVGENVVFSSPILATEEPPTYNVKIMQRTKKKIVTWIGLVDKESTKNCAQTVGSSLDEAKTSKKRRVSFVFDLGFGLGQSRPTQKGFSWYAPNETQSIPTLASQYAILEAHPFATVSAQLLSSSKWVLKLQQDKSSASGVQDPSGGQNQIKVTKIDSLWQLNFFPFGDAHPTGASVGYGYLGLATSVSNSPFERSVLRDFSCHNGTFGFHQNFFSNGPFRLQFDIDQSILSRCKTEVIAEDEAYRLEAKQFSLGRKKDAVVPASQLTNSDSKVTGSSQFKAGMSFGFYPVNWVGLKFSSDFNSLKGKIPTKSKSFDAKWTSFDYRLSLHGAL